MVGEQVVAHRFVAFLVENITSKVQQIKKETQNETARFAADEVKVNCDERQNAIDTLFSIRTSQSDDPTPEPTPPTSRRGRRSE